MTWEIVAALITLVLFLITEGGVIFKLSATLAKLQVSIDTLNNLLNDFKSGNADEHKAFAEKLFELEKRLHEVEFIHTTQCG